jgi:hypothetical protein
MLFIDWKMITDGTLKDNLSGISLQDSITMIKKFK